MLHKKCKPTLSTELTLNCTVVGIIGENSQHVVITGPEMHNCGNSTCMYKCEFACEYLLCGQTTGTPV